VVVGAVEQWLWEVVVGGSGGEACAYEGGRKGSNRLEKLPVLEYEQVTCWFRVGLLDLETMVKLSKFIEHGTQHPATIPTSINSHLHFPPVVAFAFGEC